MRYYVGFDAFDRVVEADRKIFTAGELDAVEGDRSKLVATSEKPSAAVQHSLARGGRHNAHRLTTHRTSESSRHTPGHLRPADRHQRRPAARRHRDRLHVVPPPGAPRRPSLRDPDSTFMTATLELRAVRTV